MHDLLAAFFALVFSFSPAPSVRHSETFIPPEMAARAALLAPGSQLDFAPTRQQLAQAQYGHGYAEDGWTASLHRTNVTYTAR